jgi:glutathione synthase/RimK-type ligase-like ATP-grasp enzyme
MKVALVTVDAARALDEDLPPLTEAFCEIGARVELPSWDDVEVDWASYDLALLRSTWDYTERLPEFLAWTERAARATRLFNPPDIVRWNTNKRYLHDLARAAVPIIPSHFAAPGEAVRFPDSREWVVKPSVGAGSRGAKRFAATDRDAAQAHALQLQSQGFTALIQPYLESVDVQGETALVFYNGSYSHAFRKGPILLRQTSDVQGLFAQESIEPRQAAADEIAVGQLALRAVPSGVPLYARVDLIRAGDGQPQVLELEMTEPSMYFHCGPGSAARYVQACLVRLKS